MCKRETIIPRYLRDATTHGSRMRVGTLHSFLYAGEALLALPIEHVISVVLSPRPVEHSYPRSTAGW